MRIILDTNYFYSLTDDQLRAIRARGVEISVSAMALIEASAKSAEEGRMSRLVTPAARLYPHVDRAHPIAQFAGEALKAMVAEERGQASALGDVALHARDWWEALGTRQITEAKWRALASRGALYRKQFDANWKELCRRLDPDEAARWRASEASEATIRAYVEGTLALEPAIAQRIDAWLAVITRRLERTAVGARTPAKNDARDNRLLVHIGLEGILVTRDLKLIQDVDEVASYQAPWVRTLADVLELPLPSGKPWGDSARAQAAAFVRTGRV